MDTDNTDAVLQDMSNNLPVNINVVVNDPQCAIHMSSVGILVLYYCEHCGLSSNSLQYVTQHIDKSGQHEASSNINVKQHIDSVVSLANARLINKITKKNDKKTVNLVKQKCKDVNDIKPKEEIDEMYNEQSKDKCQVKNEATSRSVDDAFNESENYTEDTEDFALNDDEDPEYIPNIRNKFKKAKKKTDKSTKQQKTNISSLSVESDKHSELTSVEKSAFIDDYMKFVDENVKFVLSKPESPNSIVNNSNEEEYLSDIVHIDKTIELDKLTDTSVWEIPFVKPMILNCSKCPLVDLHSQVELEMHNRCHTTEYPGYSFKCCLCRKRSTTIKTESKEWITMRQHLNKVHKVNFKTKCKECSEEMVSFEALKEHKNKFHRFYCKFRDVGCKYCTNSEADLKLHHDCHENESEFCCCHCGYKSDTPKHNKWSVIREHIAQKHAELLDPKNQCPGCHCTFIDSECFQDHYVMCQKVKTIKHKCIFCYKGSYVPLPLLREHLYKHFSSSSKFVQKQLQKAVGMKKIGISMFNIYVILCPSSGNTKDMVSSSGKGQLPVGCHTLSFKSSGLPIGDNTIDKSIETTTEVKNEGIQSSAEIQLHDAGDQLGCSVSYDEASQMKSDILSSVVDGFMSSAPPTTSGNSGITSSSDCVVSYDTVINSQSDCIDSQDTGIQVENCDIKSGQHSENVQEMFKVLVNEDGTHRCNMCYKKLKSKKNFLRHMAKRHPQGHDRTTCMECGKTFRTRNQCKNHYHYQHGGKERKYKKYDPSKKKKLLYCESCPYTTPHSTRLRNHVMSTHLGIMPYKCDKCTYSTNEHSDLTRHINKHLGIKKYSCQHCDYKAAQHWLLVNHCQKQHSIEIPQRRSQADLMGSEGSLRRQRGGSMMMSKKRHLTTQVQSLSTMGMENHELVECHQLEVGTEVSGQIIVDQSTLSNAEVKYLSEEVVLDL